MPQIIRAFMVVDRHDFVLEKYKDLAYEDVPLPIGSRQTISQPSTVAFMLEHLDVKPGDKVLDVGAGSGWTTALLSFIVGEKGSVIGTEIIPDLVNFGKSNLNKYNFKHAKILQANKELGYSKGSPYDKILVSAFAQEIPESLLKQLKSKGRMIIPVGESIWQICKNEKGEIEKVEYPGFNFVPLIY